MMPSTPDLLVVFVLVLLLFGPEKLPELARLIGRGMREVRKVSRELRSQLRLDDDD